MLSMTKGFPNQSLQSISLYGIAIFPRHGQTQSRMANLILPVNKNEALAVNTTTRTQGGKVGLALQTP